MSNIVDITVHGFDTWNRTEFNIGPIFGLNMEQYLISRSNFHQTSGRPTLSIFWRSRRFISYKTTQIFKKKCARRNIYLNSETLLTFFIGGGKRGWAVGMWIRVRDHCLRLFSSVLCIFLLQVCHLGELLRFGSKLDFIFTSGHNGEKLGKLLLHDLANVRLHCLEEHLKSTFHSVVLNWAFFNLCI